MYTSCSTIGEILVVLQWRVIAVIKMILQFTYFSLGRIIQLKPIFDNKYQSYGKHYWTYHLKHMWVTIKFRSNIGGLYAGQIMLVSSCYSVANWCMALCNLMNCSMPGFPVLHYLPEFTQTHVHCVSIWYQYMMYSIIYSLNLHYHC